MTQKEILDHPNQLVIPGDDGVPLTDLRLRPKRRRKAFPDGKDILIHALAPKGGNFPEGTLLPLPSVPKFESVKEAMMWLGGNGVELAGKQIVIHKIMQISMIEVEARPTIKIVTKRKYTKDELEDMKEDERDDSVAATGSETSEGQ